MMRNQSGYPDPTAERAINHVMAKQAKQTKQAKHANKARPLVYICIPIRDLGNELLEMILKEVIQ